MDLACPVAIEPISLILVMVEILTTLNDFYMVSIPLIPLRSCLLLERVT